jgi:hypothetical protein
MEFSFFATNRSNGKYDIFLTSGKNCMCYGVWTVIDTGIGGATFKNEDYPRGWNQREGTRSFVSEILFALFCSLHFHLNCIG